MVFTMEDFADYGVQAVTCGGVLWLMISSLITSCRCEEHALPLRGAEPAVPATPASVVEPAQIPQPPSSPTGEVERARIPNRAPATPKPRMYFLDNLKVFLTIIVICHHVIEDMRGRWDTSATFEIVDVQTGGPRPRTLYFIFADLFTTLNQSYFMSLFFFISGYFTPTSLDRKGVEGFMRDRFKRVGVPAVFYTYVFGPFQVWLIMTIGRNDPPVRDLNNTFQYAPYTGQIWFLYWLVFLSFIYAFAQSKGTLVAPCPQLGQIFLFAFGMGIWFVLKPMEGVFAMIPGGVHLLLCYISYFFAGVTAKRNDWVAELMSMQAVGGTKTTFFLWGLTAFIVFGNVVGLYSISAFPSKPDITEARKSLDLLNFSLGLFAVTVCLAELQFFYVFFNKSGRVSKFLCDSAYGAYIIHFVFVNFGIGIYFRLMRRFSGLPSDLFVFVQTGQQVTNHVVYTGVGGIIVSEKYTWLGMLFVCLFANLCSWPAAFFLRKLPLFNQFL